jgi:hypothetical protein
MFARLAFGRWLVFRQIEFAEHFRVRLPPDEIHMPLVLTAASRALESASATVNLIGSECQVKPVSQFVNRPLEGEDNGVAVGCGDHSGAGRQGSRDRPAEVSDRVELEGAGAQMGDVA